LNKTVNNLVRGYEIEIEGISLKLQGKDAECCGRAFIAKKRSAG
jgi:hypothetical protein